MGQVEAVLLRRTGNALSTPQRPRQMLVRALRCMAQPGAAARRRAGHPSRSVIRQICLPIANFIPSSCMAEGPKKCGKTVGRHSVASTELVLHQIVFLVQANPGRRGRSKQTSFFF